MKIPLELLRTFITCAESETFQEAGRKLGLSQPAVSVQLKKLEDLLPQPVFTLEGKRKTLTRFGRAVVEELGNRIGAIDKGMDRVIQLYSEAENITIKIGVRTELFTRVVQYIRFPGRVQFLGMSNQESITALLNHDIDIAITHQRPDLSTIYAAKLWAEGVRLAVHRKLIGGNAMTEAVAKDPAFLTRTPFLAYKTDSPFLGEWLRHCGVARTQVRVLRVCEDWRAIMAFIEQGQGYSVMPRDIATQLRDVVFHDVPFEVVKPVPFYALYHEDLRRIPAIREYLAFG
jgi:DNA-binding transcriptional LysR family regulator